MIIMKESFDTILTDTFAHPGVNDMKGMMQR
jgi:hypothetical protein